MEVSTLILGLFAVIGLVVVIPALVINRQPVRVLLVAAGSLAAFIGLAVVIFWLYFTIGDSVYDRRLDEGLAALQALFYTALVVHIAATLGAVAALTKWTRAPSYPTFAVVSLIFAILALPTLAVLSFANDCETGVSFPIPGSNCD